MVATLSSDTTKFVIRMLSFWGKSVMMSELSLSWFRLTIHGNSRVTQWTKLDSIYQPRWLWGSFQRTMFDVRIFHPNADSYKVHEIKHENIKRKDYEQRVVQVEKSSFIPLVYSTAGGMAPMAKAFHRRVAELVAAKKNVVPVKEWMVIGFLYVQFVWYIRSYKRLMLSQL